MNTFDKIGFWQNAIPVLGTELEHIKRCLVMVPHPDDESLACAGLIATLIGNGALVTIILTTDGSRSHPNSKRYPPDKLALLRIEELRLAMDLLGLGADALRCYGAVDASMPSQGLDGFDELVTRLKADLILIQPDLILVPYELDPHCDHRATHQLLISALEQARIPRPRIWEYPIWLYENAMASDIPDLIAGELLALDVAKYLNLKVECIQAHISQTTRFIDDDPDGFILLPEVIANFTQQKEYFMERKKINPSETLPKGYFEELYQKDTDPWDFEKSEYEDAKYRSTLAAIPPGNYSRALEIGCSIGVFTRLLADRCKQLLAMDISETALDLARKRLSKSTNVEFLLGGIPQDFPSGEFELIVMSEVGYYLSIEDLLIVGEQIVKSLSRGGILILVHWTHFVADYPLTGDHVHDFFNDLGMPHLDVKRHEHYRLDVYRKP
ncbi:methyltransferase domain-containing protein [Pedobacter frigidisoli]|uniref:Methyltransferase domain-containing protein n=1 Tax=Pedobacter frigidisoli TaxID=2530455 RepID=A0A4R0P378_9SPHI|nr:PIG-L family deacetylase [Pedobacter frigidisoli]TCD07594.1 methyltransferase domain-containing protein [Pedobacter frigidisoli]